MTAIRNTVHTVAIVDDLWTAGYEQCLKTFMLLQHKNRDQGLWLLNGSSGWQVKVAIIQNEPDTRQQRDTDTRGFQKVLRLTQLVTRHLHDILSLFNIHSCNWNALGLAYRQSSDFIVKECKNRWSCSCS